MEYYYLDIKTKVGGWTIVLHPQTIWIELVI